MQDPKFIQEVLDASRLLISKEQLMSAFDQMAAQATTVLKDKNPILLCVMNGGLMTMSEFAMRLNFPLQMDYLHATRYDGETHGGRTVFWRKEPSIPMKSRVVVIVDDILDGGLTLKAIEEFCKNENAKEIYTAVMLDKPSARDAGGLQKADFTGLEIPNDYVFGFGLDYKEYLRNIPGIYTVHPKHM